MASNRVLLSVLENVTKRLVEIMWLEMRELAECARV